MPQFLAAFFSSRPARDSFPTLCWRKISTLLLLLGLALAGGSMSAQAADLAITTPPQDQATTPGSFVNLSVAATGGTVGGSTGRNYAWFQGESGDIRISTGENSANFTTPILYTTAKFWVRVSDDITSINSPTVTVYVVSPLMTYSDRITAADPSFNRPVFNSSSGPASDSGQQPFYKVFKFRALSTGTYTFTLNSNNFTPAFALYKGSFNPAQPLANLVDAREGTGSQVTRDIGLEAFSGFYYFVATFVETGFTGNFSLTIKDGPAPAVPFPPPVITTQPADVDAFAEEDGTASVKLNVETSNTVTSYQWYEGSSFTNRTAIAGATSKIFTTPPINTGEIGVYSCRLTNENGYTDTRFATIYVKATISLQVDTLEDTVDANDGATSLREAMTGVITHGAGKVTFIPSLTGSINLTAPLPTINCPISIRGGILPIRIDGRGENNLFIVEGASGGNGNRVSIDNLTLANGLSNFVGPIAGALQINGGTVSVRGVTFQDNKGVALYDLGPTSANSAGAVTVVSGEVSLSNCTFTGNTGNTYFNYGASAGATGGAGAVQVNGGNVVIQHCTIVGNTGGRGGGPVFRQGSGNVGTRGLGGTGGVQMRGGSLSISNSIVCNNTAGTEGPGTVAPGTTAVPNASGSYTTGGPNLIDTDPKASPLARNGGPTETMALLPTSAAINAGATTYATNATDYDQRGYGYRRVKNGRVDIGAFEFGPNAPVNISVTPASGSSDQGAARVFSVTYVDGDGASTISEARLLINKTLSSTGSLTARYFNGKLYLLGDNGTYIGGFNPGSSNVIASQWGTLNCALTKVVANGDTLTIDWNITPSSSFVGAQNLYSLVKDSGGSEGGWDKLGVWTVIFVNNAPVNVSVSPVSSSSGPGVARTFTSVYSDTQGGSDISDARILINGSLSAANGLAAQYLNGKLYLANDAGNAFTGGFAPGSTNTITNSQGTLNCKDTTVVVSGNTVTIAWNLTPSASFQGAKNIYSLVVDKARAQDGWDLMGNWTLTSNAAPSLVSVTPASGASTTGTPRILSVIYRDTNGSTDIFDARILVNGSLSATSGLAAQFIGGKLYLANDAGNGFTGGFAPGSANLISNAQGTLDCSQTTVTRNGNDLTINWHFTPKSGFVGVKNIYGLVIDQGRQQDGWRSLGSWTLSAPAAIKASPSSVNSG